LPGDLVVSALTAPTSGGADADIVVTDTTKNQGTGPAAATSTGFYLSINGTLDASDIFLGSRSIPALTPGAISTASTTLHIPSSTSAGSYLVIAKADWNGAFNESVEANNTRASTAVKIGADLIVSALTAPAAVGAGSAFVVTEATKNQGGG